MSTVVEGLVSVIIPAFNRSAMLAEAVESVMAQTYRNFEIIICNDGSSDDTGSLADALAIRHPGVVTAVHQPNRGAGPAREAGRQRARGEFIQYLDSDDLLLPRKFEWQVDALRRHPECGASYGYIRLVNTDGTVKPGPYKGSGDDVPYLFPRMLYDRWWNTDCALFRRSVCDAVGAWSDLRFSQDWEYDARVGALKTKLVAIREFVCVQRQHAGNRQTGHGRWLSPAQQILFFASLYESAGRAGVVDTSPEMRHFSRWVFFAARDAGRLGFNSESTALLDLAAKANPSDRQIRLYRSCARVMGARAIACLATIVHSVTRRKHGSATMQQSWMENT